MIHRAMLLPLWFLSLEKPREQRHPLVLVEAWGDDLTQLILAEENGPNKRSPLVISRTTVLPPGAITNLSFMLPA